MKFTYTLLLLSLLTTLALSQPFEGSLLGRWHDDGLVGSRFYDNAYNEVWGLAVNGHEYGIIGSTWGTHFIDVTDPAHPFEAFRIAGAAQGNGIVHRDYHDYHCLLYAVSDEGQSTLQIMDISQLPDTVTVLYDSDSLIIRSHNIFIDTSAGKLYTLATRLHEGGAALAIFDLLENPLKPRFLAQYHVFGDLSVSHVHDAYVRNNIAYLNCGRNGFAIVDFTDPLKPRTLSTLHPDEYPQAGYNHSGWLGDKGAYYYMADETHGSPMKVIDVRDKNFIQPVNTFKAFSQSPNSIPHNQIVNGKFLYVSHYYDGLQVFDLTVPDTPKQYMYYPTTQLPNKRSYKGAWGVYPFLPSGNILVSDMQEGLFIIKGIDPEHHGIRNCNTTANTPVSPSSSTSDIAITTQPDHINIRYGKYSIRVKKSIRLVGLDGRILWYEMVDKGVSNTQINLSKVPPGLYVVRVESILGIISKKIILPFPQP